jgi:O-antigen ligase
MLRQHMFSRFVCSIKNNPFDFIYVLFYAGILATLAMVLVNPDEALKVFIFSRLCLYAYRKKYKACVQ